jgi:5'-nucleotidase (lipoprotein e(P4) family)
MSSPHRPARLTGAILALLLATFGARAADAPPVHDVLNAVLWMQRSVEYKANSLAAFALARIRLDQALADRNWTAAPAEQSGAYQDLPPAVVLDLDETLIDNSAYQAWMVLSGQTFDPKTWTRFVAAQISEAIPGAVEFAQYADAKGVKLFYITNRTAAEEDATRQNLAHLGFPMGGNVDTVLTVGEKPDWGSAKGTRRAYVAKDYRVLLNMGDNFGDFVDGYRGSEAERLKLFEDNRARWGREWIMLANPSYGSFESAPFGHDYKKPVELQRQAKRDALRPWSGP